MKRLLQFAALLLSMSLLMSAGWAAPLCAGAEPTEQAEEMHCPPGCPMMAAMVREQGHDSSLTALRCDGDCSFALAPAAGFTENNVGADRGATVAFDLLSIPAAALVTAPQLMRTRRPFASPPQRSSAQSLFCNFRN